MRVIVALSSAITLALSFVTLVDDAAAGGCQRQPQPGDYLNCALNGPYGPSGPNFISCQAQCNALKTCLNAPPAIGCGAQTTALNTCAPGIHIPGVAIVAPNNPTVATVAYADGVGCFLQSGRAVKNSYLASTDGAIAARRANQGTISAEECKVLSYEVLARGSGNTSVIGDVIARRLGVDRNAVTESTDLYADLGASYEDVRGIANELGGLFAVTVSDSAVKPMNTVGDILNCVESAMID